MKTIIIFIVSAFLAVTVAADVHALRVVSYNIKHGQGMDGKVDLERIAKVIAKLKPDLVALQEVDKNCERSGNQDTAARLGKILGMEYRFGKAINYQQGEYGVAVLSRFPILETQLHPLPKSREPRAALEVVVKPFGKQLSFVSLHLERESKKSRSRQVRSLLNIFANRKHPVLLAGDFNASRDSDPMQLLLANGWNVLEKNDGKSARTFHGEKHRKDSNTKARSEIDFLVIRGFPNVAFKHGVINETAASDHRPIYAELKF